MKKATAYLFSLIFSVILVFMLIAGSAVLLVDINVSEKKLNDLSLKEGLESKIYTEIEKYYSDKYNTTGIPADVYMSAIDKSYIISCEKAYIKAAFDSLKNRSKMKVSLPKNKKLEENIDSFFNDFADKNDYKKDDKFELKLRTSKDEAYSSIGSFCDVYKFSAMNNHGVLSKLSKVYSYRLIMTVAALSAVIVIILLLVFINRRKKITTMYWCGISSLIAGIIGGCPSVYLIATKFYDSFSIKQPAVFTAFTSAMYRYTEAFMAVHIAFVVIGITMIVIYGVIHDKKTYPGTKPTEI
ncbi:hypothetical protein [Ruminococcus flavefaciens]|uniref:Uncharacterized protein n=1 Tax=Ruminococcus flavefaciens TaxID=1265 RepID=A0A1M7HBF3_RUMFL|nr:hypothetical protein [Ruminococcus flavefaciens]SHM25487.1 hypothetical protein SAMN04487860_102222 [Ruminococcus flavefaciens]